MQTRKRLEGIHHGPGWLLTWVEGIEVVCMDGTLTSASFDEYLSLVESLMRTTQKPRPVLYEVRKPSGLDARARRKLAYLLKEYRDTTARTTLAYAMVTPSAAVRGILTALYWVSPPPYPHRNFSTVSDAYDWLTTFAPGGDARRFAEGYRNLQRQMADFARSSLAPAAPESIPPK